MRYIIRNREGSVIGGFDTTGRLRDADLRGANLQGADLRGADLRGAYLRDAYLPHYSIAPEGDIIGWKKLADGFIAELVIPAEARRVSTLVGRKCRAEFAIVKSITTSNGATEVRAGVSVHDRGCSYLQGEKVYPDSFDDDIRVACTHGIHFFYHAPRGGGVLENVGPCLGARRSSHRSVLHP